MDDEMSNGHISAKFMGLMHWRQIKRPLTYDRMSNKAVLVHRSIQTAYVGSDLFFSNILGTEPPLMDLSSIRLKRTFKRRRVVIGWCSFFLGEQHFSQRHSSYPPPRGSSDFTGSASLCL